MATDSDLESEVSFATSSVGEEDVQWPSNSGARAAEQIALEPGNQKEFEKFVKKKHEQIKKDQESVPGVIYLGHVPHGFAEEPLRKFFSQFGKITRLKLSRSKRTGRSKGYGFIEFEHSEVAKIAADTMNNYLMYEKLFKCKFLAPEKVHEDTFKNCDRRFHMPRNTAKKRFEHNRNISDFQHKKRIERMEKKLKKKTAVLKKLGVNYDIPTITPLPKNSV